MTKLTITDKMPRGVAICDGEDAVGTPHILDSQLRIEN